VSQRKSDRPQYGQRNFRLVDELARERCVAMLQNAPLDKLRPLEVVVREEKKARKLDQNALLWAGPLRDISEQGWIDGKQFSAEVWAHYFKTQLLPEEFDPELCLEGYSKWSIGPDGDRVLTGSTTQLTVVGFSQYIEAVTAFGANLGVEYSARPFV
jgi:hypothetical protein